MILVVILFCISYLIHDFEKKSNCTNLNLKLVKKVQKSAAGFSLLCVKCHNLFCIFPIPFDMNLKQKSDYTYALFEI